MLAPWKKSYEKPRQHVKKQRHQFADKSPSSQSYGFFSSLVWMWELDHKEGWTLKNWCFQTVVLKKTLESPLYFKEIKTVNPKGNQPWIFIGRTDAKAPILWSPDAKSWLIGKDPDAGKDWRWEKKGTTEDEMVGWHHQHNGHGFGWAPGVGDGQGGLACYGSLGFKELNTTERLNWTELKDSLIPVNQSVWYTTLIKWRIKIMISSIDAEKCLTKFNLIYDQKLPTKWYRENIPQHNKGQIWQAQS